MPPLEVSLQARLEAFKAFRVKHPRLEEMDRDLMRAISGHRSYTLLAVYGASGVGKSTVMKRVAKRCREEEPHPAVVPAVVSMLDSHFPSSPIARSCSEASTDADERVSIVNAAVHSSPNPSAVRSRPPSK